MDSFTIALDYYNSFKKISSCILDYISQFELITKEYYQKLWLLNKNHKDQIKKIIAEIKSKKHIDFKEIFSFAESIPKIQDMLFDNLGIFFNEIEKELKICKNINSEQIVPTSQAQYEECKKELATKKSELDKLQNLFQESMSKTENTIYKYYISYYNENEEQSNYAKKSRNAVTQEEMNISINNSKKMEELYKSQISDAKKLEDKLVNISKFSCENIKKVTNEVFTKFKHLILDFLISLKNIYTFPQKEIDLSLPPLISLDKSFKMNETIEKGIYSFSNDKYKKDFIPRKYKLQLLQNDINNNKNNIINSKNNNVIENIEEKLIEIEDGYGRESFFKDEQSVLTIKTLKSNFELIDLKDLNIEKEEEKRKTHELILKLVSNLKQEKDFDQPEILNIESEEIALIEILLNDHHNKVVFIHILNQFRTTGKLLMQKKTYEIFSKLFYLILDKYEQDKDIFSVKNIIVLSQTYFYKDENNKREYLQMSILNHPIFKDLNFWENFFNFEMNKEIIKMSNLDIKRIMENEENINEFDNDETKYSKLAFGQIMTIAQNMKDFGFAPEEIFKFLELKMKLYLLGKEEILTVKCLLGIDVNEEKDNK